MFLKDQFNILGNWFIQFPKIVELEIDLFIYSSAFWKESKSKVFRKMSNYSFKDALCSLGEEILIRRERSALTVVLRLNKLSKQTVFVFMTESTE